MQAHQYQLKSLIYTIVAILILVGTFYISRSEQLVIENKPVFDKLASDFSTEYKNKIDGLQKALETEIINIDRNLSIYTTSDQIRNSEYSAIKRVVGLKHIIIAKEDPKTKSWQPEKALSPYELLPNIDFYESSKPLSWSYLNNTPSEQTYLTFSSPLPQSTTLNSYLVIHVFNRNQLLEYLQDYLDGWLKDKSQNLVNNHLGIEIIPRDAKPIFQAWPLSQSREPEQTNTITSAFGDWQILFWYPRTKKAVYSKFKIIIGSLIALTFFAFAFAAFKREQEEKRAGLAMNHFLTRVAHDLKTPMTNLMLGIDVAQQQLQTNNTSATNTRIENLRIEVQRMDRLINNALDHSRGIRNSELTECDLKNALTQILTPFKIAFEHNGLELEINGLQDIRGIWKLHLEATERIIGNLLDNARRHAQQGKWAKISFNLENKNQLVVQVQDKGPGLNKQLKQTLFDDPTKNNLTIEKGAGMGIKISQLIAEKNGGKLLILDSKQGAHLKLIIPCHKISS